MRCQYRPGPFLFESEPTRITVTTTAKPAAEEPGLLQILRRVFTGE